MSISLTPVPSLDDSHFFVMAVLHKQFRVQAQERLQKNFDITLEMLGALEAISYFQPMSQQHLADTLCGERSSTKRLVDNCLKRSLVVVSRSETNKKSKLLSLTECGERMREQGDRIMCTLSEEYLSVLTPGEQGQLMLLCRKLITSNRNKTINV